MCLCVCMCTCVCKVVFVCWSVGSLRVTPHVNLCVYVYMFDNFSLTMLMFCDLGCGEPAVHAQADVSTVSVHTKESVNVLVQANQSRRHKWLPR